MIGVARRASVDYCVTRFPTVGLRVEVGLPTLADFALHPGEVRLAACEGEVRGAGGFESCCMAGVPRPRRCFQHPSVGRTHRRTCMAGSIYW